MMCIYNKYIYYLYFKVAVNNPELEADPVEATPQKQKLKCSQVIYTYLYQLRCFINIIFG